MRFACFGLRTTQVLVASGLLALAAAPAQAQVRCKIDAPAYALDSDPIEITVPLACGDGDDGVELPVGEEMVIGMTIYSDPFAEEELSLIDTMPDNPNNADRIILGDEYADSYDFPLQAFTLEQDTQGIQVVFQAPKDALAEHKYLLTVVWPIESKEECDATDEFQRQGCRDYGYLVGWDLHRLLLAYPGLVDMTDADGSQVDTVRWVVERFR